MAQIAVTTLLPDVILVCRQAPTPVLIAAYVRAARRFCLETRWLEASIAGTTAAGTATYSLGSDTYAEIFGVSGITLYETADDPIFLQEDDSATWDPTDDQDTPEFYQYLPEAQVTLHPTPDATYNMTVGAVIAPKRGSTTIDDRLVTRWEYVLQAGALSYLLKMPDVPWKDQALSQLHEGEFQAGIKKGQNAASLGFNPGATPLRTMIP